MRAPPYRHSTPQALFDAVGSDSAAFGQLARMYLDNAATAAARWRALGAAGDSAALGALCHELRGSAILLGAVALGAQLAGCEAQMRAGRIPDAAALAAVETELALVADEIARALLEFAPPRAAPPRILVVDDDALSRALLSLQVRKAGCLADEAPDGAAAIASLRRQAYQLVLMDLQMPVLDGYQASAAWRREQGLGGARTCIVGLSADAAPRELAWQQAGMDAMLRKPLHPDALRTLLARWLGWTSAL